MVLENSVRTTRYLRDVEDEATGWVYWWLYIHIAPNEDVLTRYTESEAFGLLGIQPWGLEPGVIPLFGKQLELPIVILHTRSTILFKWTIKPNVS